MEIVAGQFQFAYFYLKTEDKPQINGFVLVFSSNFF